MKRPASTQAEKMIKVDHTGENGAVNIYRAQYVAATLRCPGLKPQLKDFQHHEEEHREIFRLYLNKVGIRRCVSYHFAGIGGFALGLVTGLIGPTAIAATTYAVENVVLKHLEEQLPFLETDSHDAFLAVKAIYDDEKEHHDHAKSQLGKNSILTKAIIGIVRLSTELVIRFGMR